jgi:hypothetical protein
VTLYVLDADVNVSGTLMRAGKVIDSKLYDVTKLQGAGAVLVSATAYALARSTALAKIVRKGQATDFQVASRPGNVTANAPASSLPSAAPILVTASMSPYPLAANTVVEVDCSGGNVVLNGALLGVGDSYTVKQNETASMGGNTITVNAASGQTLSQPVPNNGTFATSFVFTGANVAGASLTWRNDGAAGGKLVLV